MTRVFVMGLGEIGLNTAKYYKDNGCTVFGWDTSKEARKIARESGVLVSEKVDNYDFSMMEVYSICVPTDAVFGVAVLLAVHGELLKNKPLFIIESTVMPGTCRYIWESIFKEELGIAHVPQRYWAEDPYHRGVRRKRIVAASDDETFIKAIKFLKSVNMTVFPTYGLEVAELCKVAENAYRYVMIAYAEELHEVCRELEIDFWAVKEAIETHQTIGYMLEPRDGIGGHCLPMAADIMEMISASNDIITGAREADKKYREKLVTSDGKDTSDRA